MTENEDEQLLEDASTLLMFANAAARQRSPVPTTDSGPQNPNSSSAGLPPSTASLSGVAGHPRPISAANATNTHSAPPAPRQPSPVPPNTTAQPPHALAPLDAATGAPVPKPHLPHPGLGPLPLLAALQQGMPPFYPYGFQPQRSSPLALHLRFPPLNLPPQLPPLLVPRPVLRPESHVSPPPAPSDVGMSPGLQPGLPAQGSFQTHRRTVSGGSSSAGVRSPVSGSPVSAAVALSRGINVETGKRNTDNAMIAAAALAAAADIPLPLKSKGLTRSASESESAPVTSGLLGRSLLSASSHDGQIGAVGGGRIVPDITSEGLGSAANVGSTGNAGLSGSPAIPTTTRLPDTGLTSTARPSLPSPLQVHRAPNSGDKGILNTASATVVKTDESVVTEPEEDDRTDDEPEPPKTHVYAHIAPKTEPLPELVHAPVTRPPPAQATGKGASSAPISPSTSVSGQQNTPPASKVAAAPVITAPTSTVSTLPDSGSAPAPPPKSEQTESVPETVASFLPPLDEYKVDPDSGLIGCICGIEEDDGFTIQCDVCFRWQHCLCMGYRDAAEIPDVYKCYYCDQEKWNKFDPDVCRTETLIRLRGEKEPRKPAPKRKPLGSGNDDKKRRKSEKDIKNERPTADKRKSSNAVAGSPQTSANSTFDINNKDNPLLEDGVCAEQYEGVYFKLHKNDYKTLQVRKTLAKLGFNFAASQPTSTNVKVMSLAEFNSIKLSKVILPNHQKYLQERNELRRARGCNDTSIQVKAYSENPKQKFVGISKIGVFITKRGDESNDTVPPDTPVVEYLGEVDTMELYMANPVNQYSSWGTVKPHVARVDLKLTTEGDPVSLVVDARFVGNEARFIRNSCVNTANCEIRTFYIPELQEFKHVVYTTKPITVKGENMEEELRLSWAWDKNHPIRKMLTLNALGSTESMKFEEFSDDEKVLLVSGVDTILNFVECACNTTSTNLQCAIFKIKKATSYLLRSTRKASSLTNIAFNKSKEELVMPKKSKPFVSWKERTAERDKLLHSRIFSLDESEESQEGIAEDEGEDASEQSMSPDDDGHTDGESPELTTAPRKLPFKQQLLAQGKKLTSRKYVTEPSGTDLNLDNSHVPKTVAIPLVSDILISIKESVNESLKPLAKISSTVNIVASVNDVAQAGSEQEKPTWKEASPTVGEKKEAPVTETKSHGPPVVKKLSFADYKKKMK